VFAESILDGTKRYEYRKLAFREPGVTRVLLYASSPVQMIIGEAEVGEVICDTPEAVWRRTHGEAGICEREFLDYFSGRERAYAIRIKSSKRYERPLDPRQLMPGFRAPQSFAYVRDPQIIPSVSEAAG
jgi:predicted transcriptional regulator